MVNKITFQTVSGERLEHFVPRLVPYRNRSHTGQLGINYEVTDVRGPGAPVSSVNDAEYTAVFSPEGSWIADKTSTQESGSFGIVRRHRTFWLDLRRTHEPLETDAVLMPQT